MAKVLRLTTAARAEQERHARITQTQARVSKRTVDQAMPHPTDDRYVWDTELRGFGVRVKSTGVRSYFVRYRDTHGSVRKYTLGRHGVLTPDEARKLAMQKLAEVARGGNPTTERRAARAQARRAQTVAQLVDRFLRDHADAKCKPRTAAEYRRLLEKHVVPALGHLAVDAVTRDDVEGLHLRMRRTPMEANRVLAALSKMFHDAEAWRLRPLQSNPCYRLKRYTAWDPVNLTDPTGEWIGQVLMVAAIVAGFSATLASISALGNGASIFGALKAGAIAYGMTFASTAVLGIVGGYLLPYLPQGTAPVLTVLTISYGFYDAFRGASSETPLKALFFLASGLIGYALGEAGVGARASKPGPSAERDAFDRWYIENYKSLESPSEPLQLADSSGLTPIPQQKAVPAPTPDPSDQAPPLILPGYHDKNVSVGCGACLFGASAGVIFGEMTSFNGVKLPYYGVQIGTPAPFVQGSLTMSPFTASPGTTVFVQGYTPWLPIHYNQVGYTFGGGGFFWEGGVFTPGYSVGVYSAGVASP